MSFLEDHGGELILLVVVLIGAIAVFFYALPTAEKYYGLIGKAWGQTTPPTQNTDFMNAMKCAYYRCTNGCDSNEVKKSLTATWPDPKTGNQVSCSDFCKAGQFICNDAAKSDPVRVDIGERAYLSIEDLHSSFGTDCITPPEFQNFYSDWKAFLQNVFALQWSIIFSSLTHLGVNDLRVVSISSSSFIEPTSAQYQYTDCYVALIKIGSNSLASVNLLPGNYNIVMYYKNIPPYRNDVISIDPYQPSSSSTSATTITTSNTCASQLGTCQSVSTCPAGHDLGPFDCPQNVQGAGTTCCK